MKAIVTGASKGIGLAIVKDFLNRGYEVWGVSRTKPEENLGKNFHWQQFDLINTDKIPSLIKTLPQKIDILVNDAGIWELVSVSDISREHYNRTMKINFEAPVFLTVGLLLRISKRGTIVNISSEMGIITEPKYAVYSASKAALDRFTTTLAKEERNLTVVGIMPASVDTPGARRSYHYDFDPDRISAEKISEVVMLAVGKKYKSGSLILATSKACLPYWETRDKFTIVDVDKL